jgi:hypothetical protein
MYPAKVLQAGGFPEGGKHMNHLDLDAERLSLVDGLLGVVTGRVEDGEETDELEAGV